MNIAAKPLLLSFALAPLLAVTACGPEPVEQGNPPLAGADIGGEFELQNTAGEPVRWGDFAGKYRIVYFGYAYCPDICPTDVQRTIQGLNQFAETEPGLAAQIQPIFITIDPERDTPEVVEEFTNAFSENLIGLTGTPEQVKEAASTFGVYYTKGEVSAEGGYLMDHSRIVFLFGPDGEPLAMLPADLGADEVTEELSKWVT